MKICYFGTYDPSYLRNRIIKEGLRRNGIETVECRTAYRGLVKTYIDLFRIWRTVPKDFSAVIVGETGYVLMPLAWLLSRLWSKKLFLDAFFSWYDSFVFDRKTVRPGTFEAYKLYCIDRLGCMLADKVLLDTKSHAEYFKEEFGLGNRHLTVIPVGTDNTLFFPIESRRADENFMVMFWGSFIPLHGIEVIIEAARMLSGYPDIRFKIIGGGQTYPRILSLAEKLHLSNIEFHGFMDEQSLNREIAEADLCLGIFGQSAKTKRVVPHKVYQAIAAKKAVITLDTPAIREAFTDRENILLCPTAAPEDLSAKILALYNDRLLLSSIASKAFDIFVNNFKPEHVVRPIVANLGITG